MVDVCAVAVIPGSVHRAVVLCLTGISICIARRIRLPVTSEAVSVFMMQIGPKLKHKRVMLCIQVCTCRSKGLLNITVYIHKTIDTRTFFVISARICRRSLTVSRETVHKCRLSISCRRPAVVPCYLLCKTDCSAVAGIKQVKHVFF